MNVNSIKIVKVRIYNIIGSFKLDLPQRWRQQGKPLSKTHNKCIWSCQYHTWWFSSSYRALARTLWLLPWQGKRSGTACTLCSAPRRWGTCAKRARRGNLVTWVLSRTDSLWSTKIRLELNITSVSKEKMIPQKKKW